MTRWNRFGFGATVASGCIVAFLVAHAGHGRLGIRLDHLLTTANADDASSADSAAKDALPNPATTPGAINPSLSERDFRERCHEKGWTREFRPPTSYTNAMKRNAMRQAGISYDQRGAYEEDHLVPLCLGGAPYDARNLWLEPRGGFWTAEKKDALERKLCRLACDGQIPLPEAQGAIAANWIVTYQKYVAPYRRGTRDEWQHANEVDAAERE